MAEKGTCLGFVSCLRSLPGRGSEVAPAPCRTSTVCVTRRAAAVLLVFHSTQRQVQVFGCRLLQAKRAELSCIRSRLAEKTCPVGGDF